MKPRATIHRQLFQNPSITQEDKRIVIRSMSNQNKSQQKHSYGHLSKMGKTKKASVNSNPDCLQSNYMKIQFMCEQQRKKLKPNTKNLFAFFPTYTMLIQNCEQKNNHINNQLYNTISHPHQSLGIGLNLPKNDQIRSHRNSFQRRKLIPIRKTLYEKRSQIQNKPKVSFLSVQKVSLIPVKKQDDMQKMSITATSSGNKSGVMIAKSLYQSQQRNLIAQSPNRTISFADPLLTMRAKQFNPPFQRYHYYDFIWKIAYSNGIKLEFIQLPARKFKIYIGPGNNSMLIKTFFKRRQSWWTFTDKVNQADFVWTQIKVNSIFNYQLKKQSSTYSVNKSHPVVIKTGSNYKKNSKILNQNDLNKWLQYYNKNRQNQQKMNPSFSKRNKYFKKKQDFQMERIKIHNHLPRNYILGNKKALFSTMKKYYEIMDQQVFKFLPLTFHIQGGLEDPEYLKFLNYYYKKNKLARESQKADYKGQKVRNIWIVKPGELSNRGNGIIVCKNLDSIKSIVKNIKKHDNGFIKTHIIQEYIDRPFLYYRRKFDIRHYMLITQINGYKKGYWYQKGYIRTTSYQYSVKNSFSSVHLTNDAIQKNLPDYGKYEKGNKISYEDFEKYLEKQYKGKYSFFQTIYPQLKRIAHDTMRASSLLLDPENKCHNFQIFGFDFMIDSNFHPWLIEINTNPCLEISCPLLMDIIPEMIQNALKIGVDSVLNPPYSMTEKRARFSSNVTDQNKFVLLYDSTCEEQEIKKLFGDKGQVNLNFKELEKDQDEVFEDDGVELDD